MALRCHERFLRNVWYFKDVEAEFIVQVALKLVGHVYCPEEVVTPGFLYIVKSGVALCARRNCS